MPTFRFIDQTVMQSTLRATLEHNPTYIGRSADERFKFRCALEDILREKLPLYEKEVNDEEHEEHITDISDRMSRAFPDLLRNKRFRIGSTQKALNLYLKCMWCLNKIPPPPHCPFDGIIISHLPSVKHIQWTKIDSLADYRLLVTAARDAMNSTTDGFDSLSHWELAIYESFFLPSATKV